MEKSPEYEMNWKAFQKELQSGNLKKYVGEYIGLHKGKIVAHSPEIAQVIKKLEELEPDPKKRFIEKSDFIPDESPFWHVSPEVSKSIKDTLTKKADFDIHKDKAVFTIDLDEDLKHQIPADPLMPNLDIPRVGTEWVIALMRVGEAISPESPKHYDFHENKVIFTVEKSESEPPFLQRLDKGIQNKIEENRPLTSADKNNILSRLGVF